MDKSGNRAGPLLSFILCSFINIRKSLIHQSIIPTMCPAKVTGGLEPVPHDFGQELGGKSGTGPLQG